MTTPRRLLTVALGLALIAGNASVCAGWTATPEARMACCAEGGNCPMHKGDSHHAAPEGTLTQAQADACCAASERDQSNQTSPAFVAATSNAVLGTAVVVPVSIPALVLSDGWRTVAPTPIAPVPRHVLLSVFLL